ncbi:histidine kinase-like protein [Paractinoplanes brasiliensis]|uniref:Histidine kinase-like protein n=3 Tax=Paractinoplanes brasiliensis TaxID=52695 RepID=A0A4R6JWT2_9ACTN|nr:histidine kinase-like protein [Actinoplanes brasiliensis]
MQHSVTAVLDHQTAIVEIAVTGAWDPRMWLEAHRCIGKCLAEHPAGMLLDLTFLDDATAGSAPLWVATSAQAARTQPPIPVAVCMPAQSPLAARLARLGAGRRFAMYADLMQARTGLAAARPLTDQILLRLHPEPMAASAARDVVTAVCQEWGMEPLLDRARLVASELVNNAVEHAGTRIDFVVTRLGPLRRGISRRPNRLRVAVYDLDPHLPAQPSPAMPPGIGLNQRGYGLRIVDAAARVWGSLPTPAGKVVWAALYDDPPIGSEPKPRR